jgi:ADP-ribosylarginine hydrolase
MELSDKFDKYFASIYLAEIGDKIGFGNGQREQNYGNLITVDNNPYYTAIGEGISTLMIFRFIVEGGIIGIDLETLKSSDDTCMHIATIKAFIDDYNNRDSLYNNVTKYYIEAFSDIPYMRDILLSGRQTLEAIRHINSGVNWKNFSYLKSAGGSGGPMRTMCIGLAFYQSNNMLRLIESTIMICSITHPNCIAFIGSIASALFTSYALKDMKPEIWIFELINLLESNTIDDIIEKIKPNYIEFFKEDKKEFLHKLLTYVETSFEDYNYIITDTHIRAIYPWKRMIYYYDNFTTNKKILNPGAGADDCIIIAYDCLLMSKCNYEKLIYCSMINIGDSDTLGSIASAWYGALYGFNNVPSNLINKLDEEYQFINNLAQIFYNKYYDKNIKEF